jgi:hypothetical protein
MGKPILLPSQIEGISTRADRTLKIVLSTQELPPNEAGRLFGLNQRMAYVGIKEEAFQESEEQMLEGLSVEAGEHKNRTPSQRLRAILYVCWKEDNDGHPSFDTYYAQKIEQIIQHFKNKLDAQKLDID